MYPKHLAMEGDKIGLQIGALNKPVQHVLIALDVTEEVVDEAIQLGANVIIAHHPLIFNPLKAIHTDKVYGKIIEKCIKMILQSMQRIQMWMLLRAGKRFTC